MRRPWVAVEPPGWTGSAVCAQVDFELFVPDKGHSPGPAKLICSGCPVTAECLIYGMNDQFGIYGGLTATERRRLRARPPTRRPLVGAA